jgi:hypothetical protein
MVCTRVTNLPISALTARTDLFLSNLLAMVPSPNYSVIYVTTPLSVEHDVSLEEPATYQMDSTMSPLVHMELKRDIFLDPRASGNGTSNSSLAAGPLFERYQFFTPGK